QAKREIQANVEIPASQAKLAHMGKREILDQPAHKVKREIQVPQVNEEIPAKLETKVKQEIQVQLVL
ncbi:hypothetical protein EBX93_11330, partial [bacterium]|nr:hypothetical protein [bacterium]